MDLTPFFQQFRDETAENVRVLGDCLLALEAADEGDRRPHLDRVFRAMHTVKGSARMLGFEAVGRLAHAIESILGELRAGRRALDRPLADALLSGADALLALAIAAVEGRPPPVSLEAELAALEAIGAADAPAPPPVSVAPPSAPSPRQTVRVRVDLLDRMLNLVGELALGRQQLDGHAEQLRALHELMQRHGRALLALEAELGRLRFSATQRQALDLRLSDLRVLADEAGGRAQLQGERLGRDLGAHHQLVKDLEQELMAARLLPLATLFAGLRRSARELAQATGKELRLELQGEQVELDRKLIELIGDPLLHLLRNAVDHGLEPAAERVAAGKPAAGLLQLRAEAVGGEVRLTVGDDGRGMDPQRLRERAVRLGLIDAAAAAALADEAAIELIFLPGFSTAPVVSEISGRGVGLDVVRANLAELGGQVRVETAPGRGTRITLTLPLTLVTSRVLLARVGQQIVALPTGACSGVTSVGRGELEWRDGAPVMLRDGIALPAVALADLLGVAAPWPLDVAPRVPAALAGAPERPTALLVDALLDEREAVVKPLGPLLARQQRFSGAVQLGDGSLVLLLSPLLLASCEQRVARAPAPPAARRRLLVVDDSFATRELIRGVLQAAGYEVAAAVDGVDGLEQLRAAPCDLVVSDVEMPRMDGLQLAASLRDGAAGRAIPLLLLSSLGSDEQRRRGMEAGASAYIVKSQFDQEALLSIVRRLLCDAA